MIFKTEAAQGDLDGFLDSGSTVEGELRFENVFRVEGKFRGKVTSRGTLIVGENGDLEGEIQVGQLLVSGRIHGHITAHQRVQIASTGKVRGDLDIPPSGLIIEDGAVFEGTCTMSSQGGKREAAAASKVTPMPLSKER